MTRRLAPPGRIPVVVVGFSAGAPITAAVAVAWFVPSPNLSQSGTHHNGGPGLLPGPRRPHVM